MRQKIAGQERRTSAMGWQYSMRSAFAWLGWGGRSRGCAALRIPMELMSGGHTDANNERTKSRAFLETVGLARQPLNWKSGRTARQQRVRPLYSVSRTDAIICNIYSIHRSEYCFIETNLQYANLLNVCIFNTKLTNDYKII